MKLKPELETLLRDVISEQQPNLLWAVDRLERGLLIPGKEKEAMRQLIIDEFMRTGFISLTDGSVERGMMLEEIGDILGDMQDEPADT